MNNFTVERNISTGEEVYKTVLNNGLRVYIAKRDGYAKKMGILGTVFGSIDNKFVDIETGKKTGVPDGIAHFLEHKLFEQEDSNALDVFSKMGADTNAYTSFDQTVYYFETVYDFEKCLDKLIDFVSTPYFTVDNVEKEKGIIEQEIKMYEDEPNALVYYNLLKAMYKNNPINVDIAGTIESIRKIDKDVLYKCYNNFYNPKNMFLVILGDLDINKTIDEITEKISLVYSNKRSSLVVRISEEEPSDIVEKKVEKRLSISVPVVCIGIKTGAKTGKENKKNTILCEIINDMYFSNISSFYKKLYEEGIIYEEPELSYECGRDFSHIVISAYVVDAVEYISGIKQYINELKEMDIDEELFNIIINKKKGENIIKSEKMEKQYRNIIDSIILNIDVFEGTKILNQLGYKDIKDFITCNFREEYMSISEVLPIKPE